MKYPEFMKTKAFKWGAGIVLFMLLAYFVFQPDMDALLGRGAQPLPDAKKPETDAEKAAKIAGLDFNKPLAYRSKGLEVQYLQMLLNMQRPQNKLVEDGIFGMKTLGAVREEFGSPIKSVTLRWVADERGKRLATNVTGGVRGGNTGINPYDLSSLENQLQAATN